MSSSKAAALASGQERMLEVRMAEACAEAPSPVSPEEILAILAELAPELSFRHAMTRSGWHRLGGVVDAQFHPVARHIREWAEPLAAGSIERLMAKCAEIRGFVTKLQGRTHYITAATGERARDFLQIEIEQVQEMVERPLWDPDWLPDDLEEFIDPLDFPRLSPEPVGKPRLLFRRLVRVADFLGSEDASHILKRLMHDWDRSSAGESARFCDHWILSIQEYLDERGDGRLSAKPAPLPCGAPKIPEEVAARGAELANLIHGFDRQAGYHFAWYFHMLTRRQVPYALAEAVHADQMGAFDYLPPRDVAVLRDWYDAPYSL